MEKAEAFEDNSQSRRISDNSISSTIIVDDSSSSDDSDIPGSSIRMPRSIYYSQLSHPPENLSRSITPDLPLPGTLDYYLASVPTTPQRMTPEPDLTDSIPYALPLLSTEDNEDSNEDILLLENVAPPDQVKGKEPIRSWELIADDIVETLEIFPLVSPKKKRTRGAKRTSVIHITAATSRPQRGIKP